MSIRRDRGARTLDGTSSMTLRLRLMRCEGCATFTCGTHAWLVTGRGASANGDREERRM